MPNSTIGEDAALARLVAAVEAETDPGWDCNSYHPSLWSALDVARAALASAAQPTSTKGELRRLRAEVQKLERELSSIGAGGVEPLRRRHDPDIARLTERGATAWAGVDAQALREGRMPPQWVPVAERLPEPGTPVLLDIGKQFPIRAMWAAKHTVEAPPEQVDIDWGEYDETTDTYYSPEGWYEWNEHEECHWFVHDAPLAWMTLPEQDRARGAQGGNT